MSALTNKVLFISKASADRSLQFYILGQLRIIILLSFITKGISFDGPGLCSVFSR